MIRVAVDIYLFFSTCCVVVVDSLGVDFTLNPVVLTICYTRRKPPPPPT